MFSIEIHGQRYDFMNVQEYSQHTGIPESTLYRRKNAPERVKEGKRVYWCPQLRAIALLSKASSQGLIGVNTGQLLKASDFEPHLKIVGGEK